MKAVHRLATYGTLCPGCSNHIQVSGIRGVWREGYVLGRYYNDGWGSYYDCPGVALDPDGDKVPVFVLESADLTNHWQRLDEFEGGDYCRTVTQAWVGGEEIVVSMYEINRERFENLV